jgi:hypothetical protein
MEDDADYNVCIAEIILIILKIKDRLKNKKT